MTLLADVTPWNSTESFPAGIVLIDSNSLWLSFVPNQGSQPAEDNPDWELVLKGGGGTSGIQVATKTLVEDDLNDNTDPVTIVAGVTGKIIVPIHASAVFNYVDNTYSTNTSAQFDAAIGAIEAASPLFYIEGFTDDTASSFFSNPVNDNISQLTAAFSGLDLTCAATGVVTESGPGSSTVTVTVAYYLVNG